MTRIRNPSSRQRIALLGALILALAALTCCTKKGGSTPEGSAQPGTRALSMTLPGGKVLRPALRATFAERHLPLGALPPGSAGLLFAYPRARALGLSVATAKSPTDVVLLDEAGKVVRVAAAQPAGASRRVDVIPELYQYALVLPSGDAARQGIAAGQVLRFELPEEARPARVLTPVTLQPPGRSAVTVLSELAIQGEETSTGLMYRRSLPPKGGMLFRFARPQVLWFYMKNTRIPLDMIFIDDARVVTGVVHRAVPFDEQTVGVGPVKNRYVLEVRAGFARRHGIGEGTRVTFRLPDES